MTIVAGGQTSYSIDIAKALVAGSIVDESPRDIISALATENVVYGTAVAAATGSDYAKILGRVPAAAEDKILGIAVADHNRSQRPEFDEPTYEQGEALGLMRQGRVAVRVEDAVVFGSQVFVRITAAGDFLAGGITSVESGETVALEGAKFLSNAAAGELAVVELELK